MEEFRLKEAKDGKGSRMELPMGSLLWCFCDEYTCYQYLNGTCNRDTVYYFCLILFLNGDFISACVPALNTFVHVYISTFINTCL